MTHDRTCATASAAGLAVWLVMTAPALAQSSLAQPEAERVAVDGLQCWRALGQRAVTVGQPFTMTVTCRVVETDTAAAIPNETTLAPETIELLPFEVIEGRRFPDRRDEPYRVFQYEYVLRIVQEDSFGMDVDLPPLEIAYHIDRALEGGPMTSGRGLRYILPPEPVRVLSLVPATASDIQDLRVASLGETEERGFRAQVILLGASAAALGAVVLLIAAGVHLRRHMRSMVPAHDPRLPDAVLIRSALGELTRLQRASSSKDWSESQTGRALSALRLAAATALALPVAQERVAHDTPERDGQLRVSLGRVRQRTTAVSASVTAPMLRHAMAQRPALSSNGDLGLVKDLADAIDVLTAARYDSNGGTPREQIARALDRGARATRALARRATSVTERITRALGASRQRSTQPWTR